jgi:DUF4097 and DUF4098 domain-containing protein YvlB
VNAENTVVKTFDGIEAISIRTSSGDTVVRRSASDQVTVTVEYTYSDEVFRPVFKQNDTMLDIHEEFLKRSIGRGRSAWTLEVPDNIDMKFGTGSGDLKVDSVMLDLKSSVGSGKVALTQVTGDIRISVGSGRVVLRDVNGEVAVKGGSGDAELKDIVGNVRVSAGSGDIDIDNLDGSLDANTGSGRIRVNRSSGDGDIDAGSGNVRLQAMTGAFKVNIGSGDIIARAMSFTGPSSFDSGSGEADIEIASALDHDISIQSGSGDATLDFNGNPIEGEIEMSANKRRGRISAPIAFDQEYEEHWGSGTTLVKKAKIGDKDIQVLISTGSGTAKLMR